MHTIGTYFANWNFNTCDNQAPLAFVLPPLLAGRLSRRRLKEWNPSLTGSEKTSDHPKIHVQTHGKLDECVGSVLASQLTTEPARLAPN